MYDFQRKHGHDINCHVLARASRCITIRASVVLNGASTCSNTCASTCITTRASTCITTHASTCHYTRARLLLKNMPPGVCGVCDVYGVCVVCGVCACGVRFKWVVSVVSMSRALN